MGPMVDPEQLGRQDEEARERAAARFRDEEHLGYVALGFYVYAALNLLCSCVPGFQTCFGFALLGGISDEPDSRFGGVLMIGAGILASLLILGYSALMALNGYLISQRSSYGAVIAITVLTCLNLPLGTLLGVFTLIVLFRDSVRELFGLPPRP